VSYLLQRVRTMRVPIRSFAVVGICLSLATALSQQTPAPETKASDPEGSRPQPSKSAPSRLSPYYDRRERAAATMTFEWESVGSRVFSKEYVQRMQRIGRISGLSESPEDPPETPTPSDPDVSEIDEKNLLLEGLRGTCRIERTPDITRVRVSKVLASISDDGLRKSEKSYQWTVFYLGKTGEAVISSLGDPSPESVVHIAFAGAGGIGLPDPILAGVRAEMLVFLGGVSPLRMFGCAPEDWKLVEVSEEAWVFEFNPDEEQRKKMAELSGFGKGACAIEPRLRRRARTARNLLARRQPRALDDRSVQEGQRQLDAQPRASRMVGRRRYGAICVRVGRRDAFSAYTD
jgi:hypothetical protein